MTPASAALEPLSEEIVAAARSLRRGEVVAFPTETFYGLAVNALDELALQRLRQLKGRTADKAISVLVVGEIMVERLCRRPSPLARRLMAAHWPGPLTLVLPARRGLPRLLTSEGCIALRESSHPTARSLVEAFGGPITATSANPAGEPAATTPEEVEEAFEGRCRVLHAGSTPGGAPSTVARVQGEKVEILRAGAVRLRG